MIQPLTEQQQSRQGRSQNMDAATKEPEATRLQQNTFLPAVDAAAIVDRYGMGTEDALGAS